jgi:hypothetical protein
MSRSFQDAHMPFHARRPGCNFLRPLTPVPVKMTRTASAPIRDQRLTMMRYPLSVQSLPQKWTLREKGRHPHLYPPRFLAKGDSSDTEEEEHEPEQDPLRPPTPEQPLPPRARKVPIRPGNIYGQKHPVEIEKQTRKKKDWEAIVGTRSSRPVRGQGREPIPGPSAPPPPPPEDDDDEDEETEEEDEGIRDKFRG